MRKGIWKTDVKSKEDLPESELGWGSLNRNVVNNLCQKPKIMASNSVCDFSVCLVMN